MRTWRLLQDGPGSGAWNMGVDEALLASAQRDVATVRLYTWDGPWLSLGYAQALPRNREEACRRADVGVVRRVTGGRAVLHGRDLTYSLTAPQELLPRGLRAAYDLVAEALLEALAGLGVEAERTPERANPPGREVFDCFARPAAAEICAVGRKLSGSAQRRVLGAVLQHGSIRLTPNPESARRATGLDARGATSLSELGCDASEVELREACAKALAHTLGCEFELGELDSEERRSAARRGLIPIDNPLG